MDEEDRGEPPNSANDVAARTAELQEENRRLRSELERERRRGSPRDALSLAASASTIGTRVSHKRLLRMIVETAARVIGAQAGSLFTVSDDGEDLVFEVAIGPHAEQAQRFTVPIGQGIAGLVAVTGQPMAVSNARSDPRHASDLAQQIGYQPSSILCVPLFYDDRVIGVLELLDRLGSGSFTPGDMELLGLFATQAAAAMELSRDQHDVLRLIRQSLVASADGDTQPPPGEQDALNQATEEIAADPSFQAAVDLARLVNEIVVRGEDEQRACHSLLSGFAEYLRIQDAKMNVKDRRL